MISFRKGWQVGQEDTEAKATMLMLYSEALDRTFAYDENFVYHLLLNSFSFKFSIAKHLLYVG